MPQFYSPIHENHKNDTSPVILKVKEKKDSELHLSEIYKIYLRLSFNFVSTL